MPTNLPEERVYFWAVLKAFLCQSKNGQDRRIRRALRRANLTLSVIIIYFLSKSSIEIDYQVSTKEMKWTQASRARIIEKEFLTHVINTRYYHVLATARRVSLSRSIFFELRILPFSSFRLPGRDKWRWRDDYVWRVFIHKAERTFNAFVIRICKREYRLHVQNR